MVELLQQSPVLFIALAAVVGLLIGSFLNVVIHRLPKMMERDWHAQCAELNGKDIPESPSYNLVVPRSACPKCGHKITALENIPVISFLFLRGKCASCATPISIRYPLVELFTGIATALVAWRFGFGTEALCAMILTWALIALSGIDFDTQLLPDSITLPILWLGMILSLFHPAVTGQALFIDPKSAILGAVFGYMSLWTVYQAFRLATGKEGMGFGDFKLLALLGAWLGWKFLPLIILLSALVGALVGLSLIVFKRHGREVPIPFGPYLAAAGWVALLWGQPLMAAYLRISGLD
ncbi:MAG: prepilin peptidase [Gammaproteobacteria bacterium]|nr:prepilin peptidase [Gammaproteobacteria bacterium]